MIETLTGYQQYAYAWFLENHEQVMPFVTALILFSILLMLWRIINRDIRMARKEERRQVADIICEAFSEAVLADKLTPKVRQKYERRLAVCMGLPDLMPKRKPYLPRVKALIVERLGGVQAVTEKLYRQRRRKEKKPNVPVLRKRKS